jgi:hypothetical protein
LFNGTRLAHLGVQHEKNFEGACFMRQAQKKSIITAALLAMLTMSVGCAVYDDHDRYRSRRYDGSDRYSRLDLDRDGRVEQWERNRWDRDRDGRVERWERERRPSPYAYYGQENRRYDRRYSDRFDR